MKDHQNFNGRLASAGLRVAPFAAAGVLAPLISLGDDTASHAETALLGLALMVVAIAGLVWATASRAPRWVHNGCVFGWVISLILLIQGVGGAGSGATLVLFIPALWMSLYGKRVEALVVLALMVAGVVGVTISDGASELTTVDLRRIVAFLTVLALAVWTVSTLVQRLAASDREAREANSTLKVVANAAQQIRQSQDPRETACRALLEITDATAVLILEPEGTRTLRATSSLGRVLPELRIPLTAKSLAGTAYQDGRMVFVSDTHSDDRADRTIVDATDARSILVQPFGHNGAVHGVFELTWADSHDHPPGQSAVATTLLAQEIGWSIERADLMSSLQRRATTDTLTGLGNRRVWRQEIAEMASGSLCVAIADLDHFKAYNDSYGHPAGDSLLRALADSWRNLIRPDDLLVRWGGEEFAIALPGCSLDAACEVLQRLRAGVPRDQTVSIGVAERRLGESVDELIKRADAALYEAKRAGRNRVHAAESPIAAPLG